MSSRKLDLKGQTFGYLKALYDTGERDKWQNVIWRCECLRCGKLVNVPASSLTKGNTKSCGCLSGANIADRSRALSQIFEGTNPYQLRAKTPKNSSTGIKGVSKYYSHGTFKGYRAYITFKGKTKHIGVFDTIDEAVEAREEYEEKYYKPVLKREKKLPEKQEKDIQLIKDFFNEHDRVPTQDDFGGKHMAMMKRHGNWNTLIKKAGFEVNTPGKVDDEIMAERIEADIKRVQELYRELGKLPTFAQSGINPTTLIKRHGTWNDLVKKAGFEPRKYSKRKVNLKAAKRRELTKEKKIKNDIKIVQEYARKHGVPPRKSDLAPESQQMANRNGGWRQLLEKAGFERKANYRHDTIKKRK